MDLIIPTMWKDPQFHEYLQSYVKCKAINKIIIIDNDSENKQTIPISDKIEVISYGENIFVNPAWNLGYKKSKSEIICILNDDVFVENDVFEYVNNLSFDDIDVIGTNINPIDDENLIEIEKIKLDKSKRIGSQYLGFGVCMFMPRKNYKIIPPEYKIWFGDDYLLGHLNNIYYLNTDKISGKLSTTANLSNPTINRRIHEDIKNAAGKWDWK